MPFLVPALPTAHGQRSGLLVALALVVVVPACMRSVPVPSVPMPRSPALPPPAADCGAERLSQMTGQHFSALDGVALPGPLRVLHPMQAITTEFSPQRLNVRVDDAGRIRALTCG